MFDLKALLLFVFLTPEGQPQVWYGGIEKCPESSFVDVMPESVRTETAKMGWKLAGAFCEPSGNLKKFLLKGDPA